MFVPEYDLKTSFIRSVMSQNALGLLDIHIERVQTILRLLNKLPHSCGILTVGDSDFKVFDVEVSSEGGFASYGPHLGGWGFPQQKTGPCTSAPDPPPAPDLRT